MNVPRLSEDGLRGSLCGHEYKVNTWGSCSTLLPWGVQLHMFYRYRLGERHIHLTRVSFLHLGVFSPFTAANT